MIFIFFCYIFADIASHVKAMSLSPFNEFHFVHQPCTNGIWPLYEWYMANVRMVHGKCTKLKRLIYTTFFYLHECIKVNDS